MRNLNFSVRGLGLAARTYVTMHGIGVAGSESSAGLRFWRNSAN